MLEHESDVPELRTPEVRAAAEGAKERFVGETLALLASTPETTAQRTVHLWSESPDHRRVMLRKIQAWQHQAAGHCRVCLPMPITTMLPRVLPM